VIGERAGWKGGPGQDCSPHDLGRWLLKWTSLRAFAPFFKGAANSKKGKAQHRNWLRIAEAQTSRRSSKSEARAVRILRNLVIQMKKEVPPTVKSDLGDQEMAA
jgi:hypothetical protein